MVVPGGGGCLSVAWGAGSVVLCVGRGGRGHGAAVARVAASGGAGVASAGPWGVTAVLWGAGAARVKPGGREGVVVSWQMGEPGPGVSLGGREGERCPFWERAPPWAEPGHSGGVGGTRGACCGAAGYLGGGRKPPTSRGSAV